ncbi:hypothetical protein RHECNPAF_4460097 [Rhizobium etli CNPAF512]|nr:hypothetical protein RHECNPAF_4460097 [Rhizobium etli CNPAF512]
MSSHEPPAAKISSRISKVLMRYNGFLQGQTLA